MRLEKAKARGSFFGEKPRASWDRGYPKATAALVFMPRFPSAFKGNRVLLEDDYRLFNCQRCAKQVRICRRCDRGHIYCSGQCAVIRRCESLYRAGARYQRTQRGATLHAARQRAWRERQMQKVTQSPIPSTVSTCQRRGRD